MGTIPYQCLYSRVDVVRGSDNYLLMEVELIEPSLYFNMDSKSPQMFAEVLINGMVSYSYYFSKYLWCHLMYRQYLVVIAF